MKLVHWPLMDGLLHLVQRGGAWAGPQPAQAPPLCTKCNSLPTNGQPPDYTSRRIIRIAVVVWSNGDKPKRRQVKTAIPKRRLVKTATRIFIANDKTVIGCLVTKISLNK